MVIIMKKTYEKAEIKVTVFNQEEVIVMSGVLNDNGEIELPFVPANESDI